MQALIALAALRSPRDDHAVAYLHAFDQRADFLRPLRGFEELAIRLEGIEVQMPQPFGEPPADQRLLVVAQPDAAVLIDLLCDEAIRLAGDLLGFKGGRHGERSDSW